MDLVIGGAYQGKLTCVKKKYGFKKGEVFDLANGFPDREYKCYTHLEALTRDETDPHELIRLLMPYIKNSVVISREIGCGIVPMDPDERVMRERHGIALSLLAKEAEHVTRVFCGIEERLK